MLESRITKRAYIIVVIILLIITTKLYFRNNTLEHELIVVEALTGYTESHKTPNEKPSIKIFDLHQPLEPDTYESIRCRKSAHIHSTETTLCVHDSKTDIYVSTSIWNNGVWERDEVANFLEYIINLPDVLVFDIGAQVGQYSLFAAKKAQKVVAIEPFYENIIRIHKAATLEKIQDKIVLITNALSDKRNEVKLLTLNTTNIGGQSLIDNMNRTFTKDDLKNHPNARNLVETILWDDIVSILPLNDNKEPFKRAIIKIDIESFEPFAFKHASKFFDTLNVVVIFMEWGNLPPRKDLHELIEQMIEFLYSRGFHAFSDKHSLLERYQWKTGWSWDIIWKKKGF